MKRRTYRPKTEPEAEVLEVQKQHARELLLGDVVIPNWPDDQLPDPVMMYNFAIRQMTILAAACPDFDVRTRASEFLCREFEPAKAAATTALTERQELIVQIRRAIAQGTEEEGEIELEDTASGTAKDT